MKLFGWWRGSPRGDEKVRAWRAGWEQALSAPREADPERLRHELDQLAPDLEDVEVETEMLDALVSLRQLHAGAERGELPILDTQHRIVGTEPCHFTAPASLPDDPAQTSGRLLITPTRALFVGAGRTHVVAWHTVHDAVRVDRDVVLMRADKSAGAYFRLNTYGDAVATVFFARHFKDARRTRL
jgi:hypothetical protein